MFLITVLGAGRYSDCTPSYSRNVTGCYSCLLPRILLVPTLIPCYWTEDLGPGNYFSIFVSLQLLDLFMFDSGKSGSSGSGVGQESSSSTSNTTTASHILGLGTAGAKAVLESLPDLWDQDQYENEYNLDSFMSALKKSTPSHVMKP